MSVVTDDNTLKYPLVQFPIASVMHVTEKQKQEDYISNYSKSTRRAMTTDFCPAFLIKNSDTDLI